jgi:hypothetical protein
MNQKPAASQPDGRRKGVKIFRKISAPGSTLRRAALLTRPREVALIKRLSPGLAARRPSRVVRRAPASR